MTHATLLTAGGLMLLAVATCLAEESTPEPNLIREEAAIVLTVPNPDGEEKRYSFPTDTPDPILTLELWPGELRVQHPAEKIELFADGTLRATYPDYRPFAGTYEVSLPESEWTAILTTTVESGIVESGGHDWMRQSAATAEAKTAEANRRGSTDVIHHRTSETLTVITIRLNSDPVSSTSSSVAKSPHVFRYNGLRTDATAHPEIQHLDQAAIVEAKLIHWAEQARAEQEKSR